MNLNQGIESNNRTFNFLLLTVHCVVVNRYTLYCLQKRSYNHGQKQLRHSPKKTSFVQHVSFSISKFHISTSSPLFNVVTT